ncbi:hypothetical protein ACSDQ9_13015 [Aestuariimicrobium soli]|uniref:hypothetical protein n=1 Tax=Aestuariimicrobium soli TaxID=2035834 RepID=UPI003EB7808E
MISLHAVTFANVDEFCALVPALNRPGTWSNDLDVERGLLLGRHALSEGATTVGVIARHGDRPVGRIAVTLTHPTTSPEHADEAHVGFLQATDESVALRLFDWAATVAADSGRSRLVGPIDGSFWNRYRLKVSGFERDPYFLEPLNPPDHAAWFEAAGMSECGRWTSTFHDPVPAADLDRLLPRLRARRERFADWQFVHPRPGEWELTLDRLHDLFHRLYADMPGYRPLSRRGFGVAFDGLRLVADPSMVWFAVRDGVTEGFEVALPDHGLGLHPSSGPTALRLGRALRGRFAPRRLRAERYVSAWTGVTVPGLGAALIMELAQETLARGAGLVGSLSAEHNPTAIYAKSLITACNHYALFARDL